MDVVSAQCGTVLPLFRVRLLPEATSPKHGGDCGQKSESVHVMLLIIASGSASVWASFATAMPVAQEA
jgi:hypothetical protein